MLTTNFLYRFHMCGLSIEQTMELTYRSRKTVENWDKGATMPPEIKRLMAFATGLTPPTTHPDWQAHQFKGSFFKLPNGEEVTARELEWAVHLLRRDQAAGMY